MRWLLNVVSREEKIMSLNLSNVSAVKAAFESFVHAQPRTRSIDHTVMYSAYENCAIGDFARSIDRASLDGFRQVGKALATAYGSQDHNTEFIPSVFDVLNQSGFLFTKVDNRYISTVDNGCAVQTYGDLSDLINNIINPVVQSVDLCTN